MARNERKPRRIKTGTNMRRKKAVARKRTNGVTKVGLSLPAYAKKKRGTPSINGGEKGKNEIRKNQGKKLDGTARRKATNSAGKKESLWKDFVRRA